MNRLYKKILTSIAVIAMSCITAVTQTTAFNYQGRLTDGGSAANGSFQMQFKLFDALSAGSQIGSTLNDVAVTVTNGTFSVKLDFGSSPFVGASRFLEVAVRRNSGESYVTLTPREQITSSPFSLRTLSAAMADDSQKLGGVNANQYATTASIANSFVRNDTLLQTANFNISGNGRVGGTFGVGTATPNSGFEMRGTGLNAQQRITDTASGNSLVLQGGSGSNLKVTGYNYGTFTPIPIYVSTDGANTYLNAGGGAVGIGTAVPLGGYRLDTAGPIRSFGDTTHFVAQTIGTTNSWARYYMRSSAQSWFMGTSQAFNGNQLYIGDETFNQTRFSIQPNGGPINFFGSVTQNLGDRGLPKIMLQIQADGTLISCYNGVLGTTNCAGISSTRLGTGQYRFDVGFPTSNAYILITPRQVARAAAHWASFGNTFDVVVTDGDITLRDCALTIFVF